MDFEVEYLGVEIDTTFQINKNHQQEFVILMKKKSADDELEDDIEEAFKVFDTNNDG